MNLKPLISLIWTYVGTATSPILPRAAYADGILLDDNFESTKNGGLRLIY